MNVPFLWDAAKAAANLDKHGVSFEEAASIFTDERSLIKYDWAHSFKEPRWCRIGISSSGRVLVVIYTMRKVGDGEEEKVRLISARKAGYGERRVYAGQ